MTTTLNALQIADALNAAGKTYFGDKARGWIGEGYSRVYFGKEFVTIERGEIHNRKTGKARALTIGDSAVDMVKEICGVE